MLHHLLLIVSNEGVHKQGESTNGQAQRVELGGGCLVGQHEDRNSSNEERSGDVLQKRIAFLDSEGMASLKSVEVAE